MINRISAVTCALGFLMVFGGVGGIENEGPLMENTIIAVLGLCVMGIGISLIDRSKIK